MSVGALLAAAAALSLERVTYAWIWYRSNRFRAWCQRPGLADLGGPVASLRILFYIFKAVQIGVFAAWFYAFGTGVVWPPDAPTPAVMLGVVLCGCGQLLNWSVFHRLGTVGVFYGDRFGYHVARCTAFPFSMTAHPQYLGAVMSIWGLFLIMRFPHPDWYAVPAVETAYYLVAARLEQ